MYTIFAKTASLKRGGTIPGRLMGVNGKPTLVTLHVSDVDDVTSIGVDMTSPADTADTADRRETPRAPRLRRPETIEAYARWMARRGLTLTAAAASLGVGSSTLSRTLRNPAESVSFAILQRMEDDMGTEGTGVAVPVPAQQSLV